MLEVFLTYINKERLIEANQRVLLTVSGGVDSIVLLDLMALTDFKFGIAHCNFSLRGEESEADELFVKGLAEKYEVPFFTKKFDTKSYAEENQVSTQMAARNLRYVWFKEIAQTHHFDCIATAHHQNDVVETVILNLLRGTGIAGLHGIRPISGHLIRPLLGFKRTEIEEYARINKLQWREDSSNQSNHYYRNKIRNEVIPVLKEINPNLEHTFEQNIEKIAAVEAIFLQQMLKLQKDIVNREKEWIEIEFNYFINTPNPEIQLYEILKPYHFSYLQTKNIIKALTTQSGKIFISPTHRLIKDREKLIISEKNPIQNKNFPTSVKENDEVLIGENQTLKSEVIPKEQLIGISSSPHTAYLDYETLKFPLEIRRWQPSDAFYPLGMKQKKKLSDFLINLKLSLIEKEEVCLLISDGKIAWVVGYRIDNRFKITDKTAKVFKLNLVHQ